MAATFPSRCLACRDETGAMMRHTIQRRAVGAADVHISVTYSGICHSDIVRCAPRTETQDKSVKLVRRHIGAHRSLPSPSLPELSAHWQG
jgi:D-arabinose 1-dehydrogenase-like Zn-dependent alcohol dehydrogenase